MRPNHFNPTPTLAEACSVGYHDTALLAGLGAPLILCLEPQIVATIAKLKPTLHRLTRQGYGLRLILDTTLDAVVVIKSGGVVVDWNDRAVDIGEADILGRRAEVSGTPGETSGPKLQ